tara:strand:+ start:99474 stop:99740 length:267 start_codon:yes stop_codon:yes gene_type:complete
MKKRLFLKLLAYIRQDWIEMSDDKAFEAENRKTRVREITSELLKQPLTARLSMLKSIQDNILIESHKQRLEFEELSKYWKDQLNKFES